jgi:hypothetical protein
MTSKRPADAGVKDIEVAKAGDYAQTGDGSGYIIRHGALVMHWGDTAALRSQIDDHARAMPRT